ncbi:DNA internalization-related competence protein ComEC/Rec2 [Candidatus Nitrotoga sp. HW29]|uniref:DNA internalization-related competence protein ComEC/Rec2 n=1 Tax=Candidatus Nitrotoga sp. HW29 TaxID=2886963 RepID=UPI001EF30B78|nr:DNA internalization-related competence protein ComEC/Rec2 [Candidatus Nitrotoga sp. HW29]CAH1905319.1 DNA internalization-related competence protein ComEC/Rec2 [Candidatus Nitrotoga sp. HW29]
MRYAVLFFALGVWLLQQQAALPNFTWSGLTLLLAGILLLPRNTLFQRKAYPTLFATFACTFGFFYAAFFAQQRLSDTLPAEWQGKDIQIIGVVAKLPTQHEHGLRFVFDVEQVLTPNAIVPPHILLGSYDEMRKEPLDIHAGERWQLTVRLKQPHGSSNPHDFDFEAWMLENKLRANGYIHRKPDNVRLDALVQSPDYYIQSLREKVRDHIQKTLSALPNQLHPLQIPHTASGAEALDSAEMSVIEKNNYVGVLTALAIGDQTGIPATQWQVFTRTGVNHLMSISGLHITMLSGLAFAVSYWLWRRSTRLTRALPARKVAALIGLLVALGYALLAGYGVPAQRTVYMLATIASMLWLSRTVAPSQILAAALLVVLLLDPWAVLSPGFWLSFGAVALIFYVTAHRLRPPHWLVTYGRVQWAMSIGLIPPLLAMFQQVSLVSPIANAFAIPLVSFVVVPLTLLGAALPFDWPLWLAHQAMRVCIHLLEWLNSLPEVVWTQHAPPTWSIVTGMLGVLWMLLPRGFPARWLGLIALLPMFLVLPAVPPENSLRLVIFDVGQGLAVAAQTRNHALLYDAGPNFNSEANSGNRILIPALRGMGISHLDGLILTHDDNDHTGGALSILQGLPVGWLSSSLATNHPVLQHASNTQRCIDGQAWEWDGVHFEVLHPTAESYAEEKIRDNNRSCVLKISTGKNSVLLAADIEKDSEWRLLKQHEEELPATLLVVPHHGSKTSSVNAFVAAVHPRYAVFTVGYRNRFGHPKEEIVERYRAMDSELLRSDKDGAIVVEMDIQNISVERYRKSHARYWQQAVDDAP